MRHDKSLLQETIQHLTRNESPIELLRDYIEKQTPKTGLIVQKTYNRKKNESEQFIFLKTLFALGNNLKTNNPKADIQQEIINNLTSNPFNIKFEFINEQFIFNSNAPPILSQLEYAVNIYFFWQQLKAYSEITLNDLHQKCIPKNLFENEIEGINDRLKIMSNPKQLGELEQEVIQYIRTLDDSNLTNIIQETIEQNKNNFENAYFRFQNLLQDAYEAFPYQTSFTKLTKPTPTEWHKTLHKIVSDVFGERQFSITENKNCNVFTLKISEDPSATKQFPFIQHCKMMGDYFNELSLQSKRKQKEINNKIQNTRTQLTNIKGKISKKLSTSCKKNNTDVLSWKINDFHPLSINGEWDRTDNTELKNVLIELKDNLIILKQALETIDLKNINIHKDYNSIDETITTIKDNLENPSLVKAANLPKMIQNAQSAIVSIQDKNIISKPSFFTKLLALIGKTLNCLEKYQNNVLYYDKLNKTTEVTSSANKLLNEK